MKACIGDERLYRHYQRLTERARELRLDMWHEPASETWEACKPLYRASDVAWHYFRETWENKRG